MFKILIAEDDRELRQLFAHVLTKNGYTVLGVSNGEEALDALEQSYYDLIISDIMMPKMDGYELVRSIRESGSSIPIMMITAKDAFDDMRLGFLSGSDDYMVKPINIGEMVLRVSALLRRAQMASERRQVIGGTVRLAQRHRRRREHGAAAEGIHAALQDGVVPRPHLHAPAAHGRHLGL